MKSPSLLLGVIYVLGASLCLPFSSQAETYLYDATGGLTRAVGDDGKSAGFALDAGMNISGFATTNPLTGAPGGQILLQATPVPLSNPTSTGITSTVNLSGFGGNATTSMTSDGNGTFSVLANVGLDTPLGTQLLEVTFTDAQGRTWTELLPVTLSSGVPAMPLWGYVVLAAGLLVLALRRLPRAALASLAIVGISAQAQDYPMWENGVMDMTLSPGESLSAGEGLNMVSGGSLASSEPEFQFAAALSVPESIDAEVAALAAALGDGQAVAGEATSAKVLRIFNWVRNNIDYEHYHGLVKGSALTLLEGSSNDFDQCALLRDLLLAAGYAPSNVNLIRLSSVVDYADLRDWFGFADEPFPGKTHTQAFGVASPYGAGVSDKMAKQLSFARIFLNNLGSGTVLTNDGSPSYLISNGKALLVFDRIFVGISLDGGASFSPLDPSFKRYTRGAAADLATASGYSRAALLAQAAGTADANSASGLNATAIGTYLTARATALAPALGSAAVKDLVQGRSIVAVEASSLAAAWQQSTYFNAANLSPAFYDSVNASAFAAYKAKVRFSSTAAAGLDYELPTSDLKGRKITLTFAGSTAELRLDDDLLADSGALGAATTMDLSISVTHPGRGVGSQAETKTYRKTTTAGDACSYAIIYGFNASERLLAKRQEQLKAYKDANKADDSREVRTELLNIMGLTWLYQSSLAHHLLASQNRVIPLFHHRFGRMAQEAGFYVDAGLQFSDSRTDDGVSDDGRLDNAFHLASLFWSAMEHGVIQQMQSKPDGSPFDAVSTVNILRSANAAGGSQKVYLARSSNWATIKPTLVGYDVLNGSFDFGEPFTDTNANGVRDAGEAFTDQTIKQNLEWLINNRAAQLLLPLNANVQQGIWTGSGWVIRASGIAGMIINGGYSGGYATSLGTVKSPVITTSFAYNPTPVYKPPVMPVVKPYVPPAPTAPRNYGSDPVDMATGGFVYASEDLTTGMEGAPRGVSFARNYSSTAASRDEQNVGFGWTHSLFIRAQKRTAPDAALGLGSSQQAAAFLTAVIAASDLYRNDATPKEWSAASLAVAWFVDQMRDNSVSVRVGKDIFQFITQPDGTYTAPAGSTLSLSKNADQTFRFKQRLGNTIEFDIEGKAARIVDVDARAMPFVYHTTGNLTGLLNYVDDHVGRRLAFGYDANKRITSVTDSTTPTRSVGFRYDANGNLDRATDPEGKFTYFDYGTTPADHRIVKLLTHDNEIVTQNVYDSLGRVERQFLHGDTNKTFRLYYTGQDNFEVNPQGGATHYFYDDRGRATGSRDADGNVSSMGYDGQDRVISRTSGAGETTGYEYDGANNLTKINHPRGGGSTIMVYDSLNRLDLLTDANGIQTDYVYFTSGNDLGKDRPQSVIAAKGTADQSTTAYTYISSGAGIGRVATITDGDGLVTTKTYDATYGQPDLTTAPGSFVTNEDYSTRGNLDLITDPNGRKTAYSYNLRRQVTSEVADSLGLAATGNRTFDNVGRTASSTAPAHNGNQRVQTSQTYNPTDKVRLEKLNATTVSDTTYDSRDWSATMKDAANRTTTFVRKANGDMREAQRPASRTTKFAYDGDNRLVNSTNPGSNSGPRVEGFAYDTTAGGAPRTLKTEADGRTVTSEFDKLGRLRFAKDRAGNTFEFRYDALGRRTHVLTPQNQTTITTYKKNGRPNTVTEPSGDTATFAYNATTGRLASVAYSGTGGGTVNYTSYDSNGNLLALNEGGGNGISRTYDGLNRVTSYTFGSNTIGYRYYANGALAKLIYPGGSENGVGHVEYTYNADGRLSQVIDKLDSTSSPRTTTYYWNSDGRLQSISRPNGTTRSILYDTAGRPYSITESAGLTWAIGYWTSDDIKSVNLTPAIPANQLAGVPNAALTFDSANQIATFNGAAVTHDTDGNMVNGPIPSTGAMGAYTYDSRNRLTSAGNLTYTYNAEGNRVAISGNETTTLVVDPNSALPKVLSRTKNGVTTRYVYGAGLQYEVNSAGTATYYHYDQTGNTAALTNQSGTITDRLAYSPYGTIRYRTGTTDTPFLFGGFFAVMTDTNGLINMRARYYNPLTMRFINSDPARDTLNWYAYSNGNPINFADPSGFGASRVLDAVQVGLTGLGFAPGIGIAADIVNAGISGARGDAFGAGLSLAAAIPIIGDAAAAGRIVRSASQISHATKAAAPVVTAAKVEAAVAKTIAPRSLTQADLGIRGSLQELKGTFALENGVARVRVDMIRGEITNPFKVIDGLSETAKAQGATSLRIESTLANERLYNLLQKRYGLVTEGSNDIISIPLK